jgi:APA family basic amino acid/polyamine antiporter
MPIAIIGSLIACTVLYIVVSAIATGVVPYADLDVPAPIAKVADYTGLGFFGAFIKIGAIAGLTSVILVQLLGQSRIFYSMSRDGLLPPFIRRVHPRFRTPYITSIVTGLAVSIPAAILPVRDAAKLVSIGTLLAFVIVCCGVLVLRIREPNLPRPFKTPLVWFVAPMGALSSGYLMAYLDKETWLRLLIWLVIGLAIYFFYSRSHSRLAAGSGT